jgi:drug/metabolite transporter superfamily protein YnfA
MSVEQFTVQSSSIFGLIGLIVLAVTGIIVIVLAATTGRRAKAFGRAVVLTVVGLAIIVGGWCFFLRVTNPQQ